MLGAVALGLLKLLLGQQTLIDNSLVLGAILLLVVLLLPRGLVPSLVAWRTRRDRAVAGRGRTSGPRRRRPAVTSDTR